MVVKGYVLFRIRGNCYIISDDGVGDVRMKDNPRNFNVFISEHKRCLIIQRLDENGEATGGIELFEQEYADFMSLIRDSLGLLRVKKMMESGNLPSIKIETVGDNLKITQDIPCNGIVMRVPEGIELFNMKLKQHIKEIENAK